MFVRLSKAFAIQLSTGAAGVFQNYRLTPNDAHVPFNGTSPFDAKSTAYDGFSQYCSANGPYLSYIVHAVKFEVDLVQTTPHDRDWENPS